MKLGTGVKVLLLFLFCIGLSLNIDCSRREKRPNILLIVIDALRPDHLSFNGYTRPTSPNIDRFAQQSVVFQNAISAASWTKPSFTSFLTGLYPCQHGVTGWESVLHDSVVTLAELLKEAGYGTGVIMNIGTLSGRFNVFQGFDFVSEANNFERDALATNSKAMEMIRLLNKPFFAVVHYIDVHWPYKAPSEYYDLIGEGESFRRWGPVRGGEEFDIGEASVRARIMYDACIRFVDDRVGELIKFLEEEGLRESTVIIVTADHGEAFWEHGTRAHAKTVYDEEVRVPLIFNYPKKYSHRVVMQQVSLVDLTPTIAALANVKDTHHREGRNLLRLIENKKDVVPKNRLLPPEYDLCEVSLMRVPATKAIRSLRWKIIAEPSTGLIKIFDLENDPGETKNLWESHLPIKDSLVALLGRIPGISVRGWRVGFTGKGKNEYRLSLEPHEARIRFLEPIVGDALMSVEFSSDSSMFYLKASMKQHRGLAMLWFDLEPPDAQLKIRVLDGEGVFLGAAGGFGKEILADPSGGLGVPSKFIESRETGDRGIFVWWLPGEQLISGKKLELSPEEVKRLRALGYLQ